eukprot:15433407-Alexandrium_andersonii.AAC.1
MQTSLRAFEPGTARAQERPQHWPPKLWRGAFCAIVCRDVEFAVATGRRARQRHFLGGSGGAEPPREALRY